VEWSGTNLGKALGLGLELELELELGPGEGIYMAGYSCTDIPESARDGRRDGLGIWYVLRETYGRSSHIIWSSDRPNHTIIQIDNHPSNDSIAQIAHHRITRLDG
jgi:hypothetical protein